MLAFRMLAGLAARSWSCPLPSLSRRGVDGVRKFALVPVFARAFREEVTRLRGTDTRGARSVAINWARRPVTVGLFDLARSFSLRASGPPLPILLVKVAAIPTVSTRAVFHPVETMAFVGITCGHRHPRCASASFELLFCLELPSTLEVLTDYSNKVRAASIWTTNVTPLVVSDVLPDARVMLHLVPEECFEQPLILRGLDAQHDLIPIVHERFEIIADHVNIQKALETHDGSLLRWNLVMVVNDAKDLPSLEKLSFRSKLLLHQTDLTTDLSHNDLRTNSGQLGIERWECTGVKTSHPS